MLVKLSHGSLVTFSVSISYHNFPVKNKIKLTKYKFYLDTKKEVLKMYKT